MSEPLRILHITEMLSAAGIESFIMNMYRNVDRTKVQFDFLVLRNQKEFYDEEVNSLGGHKYFIHSDKKNTWLRVLDESRQIEAFLKEHPYKIVHIHYTTPLRVPYLLAAKKAGVPIRIYHAHSAAVSGKSKIKLLIYDYYRNKINDWGTDFFACSKAAAQWIYPQKMINENRVIVVPNGIDTERFRFNKEKRNEIRNEYSCLNKYILINTGRYSDQKNQEFLIKLMPDLLSKDNNIELWLLGKGDYKNRFQALITKLGLEDSVRLLGVKSNVEDYLSAADCYLMPSLYEGLPVAGIEAECNGLPCIFSENITKEVKLIDSTVFLSLNDKNKWVDKIMQNKDHFRCDESNAVSESGYDVKKVAKNLQQFYIDAV